jgi:hypothetical protein
MVRFFFSAFYGLRIGWSMRLHVGAPALDLCKDSVEHQKLHVKNTMGAKVPTHRPPAAPQF